MMCWEGMAIAAPWSSPLRVSRLSARALAQVLHTSDPEPRRSALRLCETLLSKRHRLTSGCDAANVAYVLLLDVCAMPSWFTRKVQESVLELLEELQAQRCSIPTCDCRMFDASACVLHGSGDARYRLRQDEQAALRVPVDHSNVEVFFNHIVIATREAAEENPQSEQSRLARKVLGCLPKFGPCIQGKGTQHHQPWLKKQ
mmetsp:Transcript_10344/g.16155  ORF Transcript_10344/g.16155 Transcript_10344/m.16155 type:complete len:201 (-) Transcript_10344:1412-2014(-)